MAEAHRIGSEGDQKQQQSEPRKPKIPVGRIHEMRRVAKSKGQRRRPLCDCRISKRLGGAALRWSIWFGQRRSQVGRRSPTPLKGHHGEILDNLASPSRRAAEGAGHALLQEYRPRQVRGVKIEVEQLIVLNAKSPTAFSPAKLVAGIAASAATPGLKRVLVYERHDVTTNDKAQRPPK